MAEAPYFISFDQVGTAAEGILTSTQCSGKLPFAIKRVFWIQATPPEQVRGKHANKATAEILVAIAGSIKVKAETSTGISEFILSSADQGLYIPAMCWTELTFEKGAVALCLASTDYDEQDYLRNYDEYKQLMNK